MQESLPNGRALRPADQTADSLPLTENGRRVLERRYLIRDEKGRATEKPDQLFRRVARNVAEADLRYDPKADVEAVTEEFYGLMSRLEFMPNSPTLMNAGRALQQLSACYVVPIEDSMESIFKAVRDAAIIHKSGGGTGFSFSKLRPKNDVVSTTYGLSSGPVSFMRVFDAATDAVNQGGFRRGANMAIMEYTHPDILGFIGCKRSNDRITNFNISVGIDEQFMRMVADDDSYSTINPRNGDPVATVRAREVFEAIVDNAWHNGDPGIVFLDRINRDNPTPALGRIESTNPCVAGDTWVMTPDGARQVLDVVGKPVPLLLNGEFQEAAGTGFFETGVKTVLDLVTDRGYRIKLTADHPVRVVTRLTRDNVYADWKPAGQLKAGDAIVLTNNRDLESWPGAGTFEEGYLLGLLVGDGTVKRDESVISVWGHGGGPESVRELATACAMTLPHRADFQGFQREVEGRGEFRLKLRAAHDLAAEYAVSPGHKRVTPQIEHTGSEFHRGFLRGLFDADGSVQGTQRKGVSIRLAQSDLETLQAVQRMLHRFGILSTLYEERRPEGRRRFPDGKGGTAEYQVRSQHELVISEDNVAAFAERVGFGSVETQELLLGRIAEYRRSMNRERFIAQVARLEDVGKQKVYDVQIPGTNAFDANGLHVHNCGEQPLLAYEACNLGSINLARFVDETGIIWERLREAVRMAVRFLDNVIDQSRFPLPEITTMVHGNRKIGLGIMGWADLLISLGVPYDSQEAIDLAGQLMRFVRDEGHRASQDLAEERGAFPNFKGSIYDRPDARPMRNATVTTIAPTGSISIIAGCSSGIEPLFAVSFVRNVMDNTELLEVNPAFERVARERGFHSEKLMQRTAHEGSVAHIDEVPDDVRRVFVTAHDISPEWHLRMQAAFQRYTDNAVSKTVNFPREATRDDVRRVFALAHELGCKGVTIYRDGSREQQVLSTGKTAQGASTKTDESGGYGSGAGAQARPPRPVHKRRPLILNGKTIRMETGCGSLYVTVNEDDEGVFEVFNTMGKAGGCAASQCEAIGRLISLAWRSDVDVERVVKQLRGIHCQKPFGFGDNRVNSCADAIGRAIQIFLKQNGSRVAEVRTARNGEACPACGGAVEHEGGCTACRDCGYSDCA